jgi:GxxExxY protein
MLESVYEACLGEALRKRQIQFERQKTLPLVYEGLTIPEAYRVDLIVEDSIIIEIKSVEHLLPVHEAQLLTYLRLAKIRLGLLIKFNVAQIRVGIRRMIL